MKPVKTFRSRGVKWKFKVTPPVAGDIKGDVSKKTLKMQINGDLEGQELLDTVIHEFLHTAYWDLDEEAISEAATDMARLLWRLGVRWDD